MHKEALEQTLEAECRNFVTIRPTITTSILTSASLLASMNRHELVRNSEGGDNMTVIRRILGWIDQRQPHWRYENDQTPRIEQYRDAIHRIDTAIEAEKVKRKFAGESEITGIDNTIEELRERRQCYELVAENIKPMVRGTFHPDGLPDGAEGDDICQEWRLRGVYCRLAGPRKATKAGAWKRSAGAISISGVKVVDAEEANVQIPSRTGTYGLTVRMVWRRREEMLSELSNYTDGVSDYHFKYRGGDN